MIAATDVFGEESPMHLDIMLCNGCGDISVFDFTKRKNSVRKPTAQERLAIDKNASLLRLRQHQHELRNRSNH